MLCRLCWFIIAQQYFAWAIGSDRYDWFRGGDISWYPALCCFKLCRPLAREISRYLAIVLFHDVSTVGSQSLSVGRSCCPLVSVVSAELLRWYSILHQVLAVSRVVYFTVCHHCLH